MECHIVYTRTREEADTIARHLNNRGIPTQVKNDSVYGYSVHTDKEHQFKAQLIYLSRLNTILSPDRKSTETN